MSAVVVNFARDRRSGGKFVVLLPVGGGDGLVVFSNLSLDAQHADIVRRWEQANRTSLAGAGFRVAGGGWWKIVDDNRLKLHGRSAAYGKFDPAWAEKNLRPADVFSMQALIVE